MAESQNIEYKEPWWSVSCKERYDTYFRYMNEEASENYDMRCRYLYKIYQVGISPMYTMDERKSVIDRLLKNASDQTDENNRALDLICAYKIIQYNGFDLEVPHFRVSETLWLKDTGKGELPKSLLERMSERQRKRTLQFAEHLGPNEEILNLYNVAIQRDWFANFNPMKTEINDGLFDGMNEIEAFNRRNNNVIKCIIISLLYNQRLANTIKYYRLSFNNAEHELYEREIKDIRDLNLLKDSGNVEIEYYWIVFNSSPELFDKNCKADIGDITTKTYKITMFYKDFDHSSGNLHVVPGAMQVWEKEENSDKGKESFWIRNGQVNQNYLENKPGCKCSGGDLFAEEGWRPIAYTDMGGNDGKKSNNQYIFWCSWADVWKHLRFAIGKEDFNSLNININCRAGTKDNSTRFNTILIDHKFIQDNKKSHKPYKQYEGMRLGRYGTRTYDILKFRNEENRIISGYKIIYVDGEGFFYDFNGIENEYAVGHIKTMNGDIKAETKSPNDFIIVEDNKGYWKLKY